MSFGGHMYAFLLEVFLGLNLMHQKIHMLCHLTSKYKWSIKEKYFLKRWDHKFGMKNWMKLKNYQKWELGLNNLQEGRFASGVLLIVKHWRQKMPMLSFECT